MDWSGRAAAGCPVPTAPRTMCSCRRPTPGAPLPPGPPAAFRQDLLNIAMTTLSSKILTGDKEHFAALAVDAILRLKGSGNLDAIHLIKKPGGTLRDSFLDEGFILDKKIGVGQPKRVENARVLIANTPMDTDKIKIYGARVKVDSMAKVCVCAGWRRGGVGGGCRPALRAPAAWVGEGRCAGSQHARQHSDVPRLTGEPPAPIFAPCAAQVAEIESAEKNKMKEKCEKILSHNINCFINRQLIYNYPEEIFADAGERRRLGAGAWASSAQHEGAQEGACRL